MTSGGRFHSLGSKMILDPLRNVREFPRAVGLFWREGKYFVVKNARVCACCNGRGPPEVARTFESPRPVAGRGGVTLLLRTMPGADCLDLSVLHVKEKLRRGLIAEIGGTMFTRAGSMRDLPVELKAFLPLKDRTA